MKPSLVPTGTSQPILSNSLQSLLSQSEDEFYGRLQRIWNNVVQLEDMGLIRSEEDKFMYAYRFAEAELQRACAKDYVPVAAP